MNDGEFKNMVIKKLNEIEHRLTRLENDIQWISRLFKIATVILGLILAKMGVDVAEMAGGV